MLSSESTQICGISSSRSIHISRFQFMLDAAELLDGERVSHSAERNQDSFVPRTFKWMRMTFGPRACGEWSTSRALGPSYPARRHVYPLVCMLRDYQTATSILSQTNSSLKIWLSCHAKAMSMVVVHVASGTRHSSLFGPHGRGYGPHLTLAESTAGYSVFRDVRHWKI
jgi:hypothetical protein